MSELRETNDIIAVIGGKEYPLRFSMASVDAVLERYPDLKSCMQELTGAKKLSEREVLRLYRWIATLMIETEDGQEFTEKELAKMLTPAEFFGLRRAVNQAIHRDLPVPEEAEPSKN